MASIDSELSQAWLSLEAKLAKARKDIRCTRSSAWYRGHSDSGWKLLPTGLRFGARDETDTNSIIGILNNEINVSKLRLKKIYENKTIAKKTMSKTTSATTDYSYRDIRRDAENLKQYIADKKRKIAQIKARILGEQDTFDEFSYRSGAIPNSNSWSILVDMRHHGAPTRLLDWTDNLQISLYFATRGVKEALLKHGYSDIYLCIADYRSVMSVVPDVCVWIMNPYNLSKKVSGRFSVVDVSRDPGLDYYSAFLLNNTWPYDPPLPIFPPAQDRRVDSQKSFFTVHGNIKDPLEAQISDKKILQKIEFSAQEAIYALYFVEVVFGIDEFSIFRDKDALGKLLTIKFATAQEWKQAKS